MNVLVIGQHGFIGHQLSHVLSQQNHTVFPYHYNDSIDTIPRSLDWVFHVGGINNDETSGIYDFYKANVDYTVRLLEEIRGIKIKKFVYLTTTSLKNSPYVFSKVIAGQYIAHYGKTYDIPYSIVCVPSVYRIHPPQGPLIEKLMDKKTIYGDGTQEVELVHIDDVIQYLLHIVSTQERDPVHRLKGKLYSLNTIAEMLAIHPTYVK